ncbi:hypothetical protein NPS01_17120 [Nocardioides psychrotolerans]|uniref:DUF4245 domain-containing protein n=1 Tax=Nocardioides psychrotolerans TaxID=1005945 RepID=A0A1I3IL23_9ACTN|nr:DUF4245 family protein [Nocardioides psychrotolerans]GEP38049.1 hypothetical protein NPS01_17120 [Nocardioides psychrotolerans]SFI48636.1 Protein of unknown function [Nocardioides psychrotolerans]
MSESGTPGRYNRSVDGLVAALVITVVAVLAWVVFRALTSQDEEIEPGAVDYLETVELAQDSDIEIAYPAELPDGWKATNVTVVPGEQPAFGLSILTDAGTFVGVRQEDESLDDLLATYVDEEPENISEEDALLVDSPIATTWEGYSDEGGDLAYAAELGEDRLLVYGSASQADLVLLIESLTTAPLTP